MFLVAILDFAGRCLWATLCLLWYVLAAICKLLVQLPRDITRAVRQRQRQADKRFSEEVDADAEDILAHLPPDPEPLILTDEQVGVIVAEADLLIHPGGQPLREVAGHLGRKYGFPVDVMTGVLMDAEAHQQNEKMKGAQDRNV